MTTMDDKTLIIQAPDGTKLRAKPFTDGQLIAFSLMRGSDVSLTMNILATLFRSAFGTETYGVFAVRMAEGDATASFQTMITLIAEVAKQSKAGETEEPGELTPVDAEA